MNNKDMEQILKLIKKPRYNGCITRTTVIHITKLSAQRIDDAAHCLEKLDIINIIYGKHHGMRTSTHYQLISWEEEIQRYFH